MDNEPRGDLFAKLGEKSQNPIRAYLEQREMRKKIGNFETTPEGLAREYDLIEAATGIKFSERPRFDFWQFSFGAYLNGSNEIFLPRGLGDGIKRLTFWHESGHALLWQNPHWREHAQWTITEVNKTEGFSHPPDPFLLLRDLALDEGLTRYLTIPAIEKILPYLRKGDKEDIKRGNMLDLRKINPLQFLEWCQGKQEKIRSLMAEIESSTSSMDALVNASTSEEKLKRIGIRLTLITARLELDLELRGFAGEGHYIGTNYVLRLVQGKGLRTFDEVVKTIVANPPKTWAELLDTT